MLENEQKVLKTLAAAKGELSLEDISAETMLPQSTIASAVSAMALKEWLSEKTTENVFTTITPEGEKYLKHGTPEKRLVRAAAKGKTLFEHAAKNAGLSDAEKGIALKWGKQISLFSLKQTTQGLEIELLKDKEDDLARDEFLHAAQKNPETAAKNKIAQDMQRTGLVTLQSRKSSLVKITAQGRKALEHEKIDVSQLTPDLLKGGKWKGVVSKLKPYDLSTVIAPSQVGRKHAYKELFDKVKDQLVGLGFKETHGPLVELDFWNSDALFMPQDHPAREIHDIFELAEPNTGNIPKRLSERVKLAHETGGASGSTGWHYSWNKSIAEKLVMRSHCTSVSARSLAKGIKPPARLFTIGKVFRPDTIDWSHFIEFNQLDGIVVDEDMSLAELLGYLKRFAIEIFGATGVKFVPSYFPFTEPSVEMYAEIPGRGWVEVGGSGMFRPEMLEALNIDVPVLAWGLGIDRLASMTLGISDIRMLHSTDLAQLKK